MVKDYIFFTGNNETGMKTDIELEKDIVVLVRNRGGILTNISHSIRTEDNQTVFKRTKLYEIPDEGAVYVYISNQRDVHCGQGSLDHRYSDGLVKCLGFKETEEQPNPLHTGLIELCEVYSSDRKQDMQNGRTKLR